VACQNSSSGLLEKRCDGTGATMVQNSPSPGGNARNRDSVPFGRGRAQSRFAPSRHRSAENRCRSGLAVYPIPPPPMNPPFPFAGGASSPFSGPACRGVPRGLGQRVLPRWARLACLGPCFFGGRLNLRVCRWLRFRFPDPVCAAADPVNAVGMRSSPNALSNDRLSTGGSVGDWSIMEVLRWCPLLGTDNTCYQWA
jgi:hypothetical protein